MAGLTSTNGINNTGNIINSANIQTATLNTTGLATLNSANIINNATVGGSLGVVGNAIVGNNLAVGGNTNLAGTLNVAGNAALSGQQITLGAANGSSVVTVPGLSTFGPQRFVTSDFAGNLSTSPFSVSQYTQGLQAVEGQVSSVGAMAAALTAIPNITIDNKTFGCGIGTGAFGSSWAGALGCVGKVSKNVWINGALSFTPSVTTAFATTPSVGGRLGIYFQF